MRNSAIFRAIAHPTRFYRKGEGRIVGNALRFNLNQTRRFYLDDGAAIAAQWAGIGDGRISGIT